MCDVNAKRRVQWSFSKSPVSTHTLGTLHKKQEDKGSLQI